MTRRGDELEEVLKELRREHREITAPESLGGSSAGGGADGARPVEVTRAPVVSWWNLAVGMGDGGCGAAWGGADDLGYGAEVSCSCAAGRGGDEFESCAGGTGTGGNGC